MAKQLNLYGGIVAPASKRICVRDGIDKFKQAWTEFAPWPIAPGSDVLAALPATWHKLVEEPPNPGMICLLCEKFSRQRPPPGKPVWSVEPYTLFRLQSVHRHANSNMHRDSIKHELDRQVKN